MIRKEIARGQYRGLQRDSRLWSFFALRGPSELRPARNVAVSSADSANRLAGGAGAGGTGRAGGGQDGWSCGHGSAVGARRRAPGPPVVTGLPYPSRSTRWPAPDSALRPANWGSRSAGTVRNSPLPAPKDQASM